MTLTGGQQYFMELGPLNPSDDSLNSWFTNDQGVTGTTLVSIDGGSTWAFGFAGSTLGAFDVLGTASAVPEPETMVMFGSGLSALGLLRKRLHL